MGDKKDRETQVKVAQIGCIAGVLGATVGCLGTIAVAVIKLLGPILIGVITTPTLTPIVLTDTPTLTNTPMPAKAPSPTFTPIFTSTPTPTTVNTPTPITHTPTFTSSPVYTPTNTNTPTRSTSPTSTPTPTPTPTPSNPIINFWADKTRIDAGECTMLHWHVENVSAIHLDGEGVSGPDGSRKVCPENTMTYSLRVDHLNGMVELPQVIVQVIPPTPSQTSSPPTNTPTPAPLFQSRLLPSQDDVYAQNCPLIDQTTGFFSFWSGDATIFADLVSDGHTGPGLGLNFEALAKDGHYSGWEVQLGNSTSGIDLTPYSSLVFFIRGPEGGTQNVYLNVYLMMPIIDEVYRRYYQTVWVSASWQQVVIPLEHFKGKVDLGQIQRIQVLFEWYQAPTSGTVYIDDLCVVQ
jgi:hypothetical protein